MQWPLNGKNWQKPINISQRSLLVQVFDANGKEVPAQLLNWFNGKAHACIFSALQLHCCSIYDVRSFGKNNKGSFLKATSKFFGKTASIKLTLDTNGDIVSIVDKRSNKETGRTGQGIPSGFAHRQ